MLGRVSAGVSQVCRRRRARAAAPRLAGIYGSGTFSNSVLYPGTRRGLGGAGPSRSPAGVGEGVRSRRSREDPLDPRFVPDENTPLAPAHIGEKGLSVKRNAIDMLFVGTGAMMPTKKRIASCTLLRYDGQVCMFDCGEGAQINLNAKNWGLTGLTKIFITHLHGDHILGLPGLLMFMANIARQDPIKEYLPRKMRAVEIFGPPGLAAFLQVTQEVTGSKMVEYTVYEIQDIPSFCYTRFPRSAHPDLAGRPRLRKKDSANDESNGNLRNAAASATDLEQSGNVVVQIDRETDGFWTLVDNPLPSPQSTPGKKQDREEYEVFRANLAEREAELGVLSNEDRDILWERYKKHLAYNTNGMRVRAGPMSHTVQTLGFTVETPMGKPGMSLNKLPDVFHNIDRNAEVLVAEGRGWTDTLHAISSMEPGDSVKMPDGTVFGFDDLYDKDEIIPSIKLAILGDTRDAGESLELVRGANVLVHEATNIVPASARVESDGKGRRHSTAANANANGKSRRELTGAVYVRGHSTPEMAGKFAEKAEVGSLVLNHISQSIVQEDIQRMRDEASQSSGLTHKNVLCAKDNMLVEITVEKRGPRAGGLGNCYDVHDIRDDRPHKTKNYTQTVWRGDAAKKRETRKKRAEVNKLRRHVMQKMTQLEHPESEEGD